MTIYVDADACPVTRIVETLARKHGISVLLCDTNHQLTSDYSTVKVIGSARGRISARKETTWLFRSVLNV